MKEEKKATTTTETKPKKVATKPAKEATTSTKPAKEAKPKKEKVVKEGAKPKKEKKRLAKGAPHKPSGAQVKRWRLRNATRVLEAGTFFFLPILLIVLFYFDFNFLSLISHLILTFLRYC